jgi:hypothetical protein
MVAKGLAGHYNACFSHNIELLRSCFMFKTVFEAIRLGEWDYEPRQTRDAAYDSTGAMPGTDEKVNVLAERLRQGLPLWHPSDRISFDDPDELET